MAEALRQAAHSVGASPVGFTARTRFDEVPVVELAVEGLAPAAPDGLARAFDAALQRVNIEYGSKRSSDRLGMAEVRPVRPGTYARFRAARVAAGAPEGQVKDPIVALNDTEWGRVLAASEPPQEPA